MNDIEDIFCDTPLIRTKVHHHLMDRSLMIGWRRNFWNPERVSSLFLTPSVCLSVSALAIGLTFWPRNLIFWFSYPWEMRKKCVVLFFKILIFTFFIGILFIFSLYNTSPFFFSSNWSLFFTYVCDILVDRTFYH